MENTKVKATKEMVAYMAKLNAENNKRYSKNNEINRLRTESTKLIDDIAVATIGYGLALKVLEDKKQSLEKEISRLTAEQLSLQVNVEAEFVKKFGIATSKLDFYYPISESDDLKPITEEDIEE